MPRNQRAQSSLLNKRHIAAENQQLAVKFVETFSSATHCMARAKLFFLDNPTDVAGRIGLLNRVGAMTDDHGDSGRAKLLSNFQRMEKQRLATQRMQYLGQVRFHSSPLAGCQNYDTDCAHTKIQYGSVDYNGTPVPIK